MKGKETMALVTCWNYREEGICTALGNENPVYVSNTEEQEET